MTRKIVDYKWVSDFSPDFVGQVQSYLQTGWQPYGSPIYDNRMDFIHQAMVKYEEDDEKRCCGDETCPSC